jgi:hypothetical protein
MEFHGFKIDFNALAMFVTAVTAAYATIKGVQARKRKGHEDAVNDGEGDA